MLMRGAPLLQLCAPCGSTVLLVPARRTAWVEWVDTICERGYNNLDLASTSQARLQVGKCSALHTSSNLSFTIPSSAHTRVYISGQPTPCTPILCSLQVVEEISTDL